MKVKSLTVPKIVIMTRLISSLLTLYQTTKNLALIKFNTLPNDKIFALIKLKALADDNLNVATMTISVFDQSQ